MPSDPMKRRIRLRDLDTLLAVVRNQGLRKAARELSLSQPAVSKAVRTLEDTLGVPLLDRSRRGAEPTAYGLALARRTTAAFDELRQAVRDIEHLADPDGGELHGAAMETLNAGLLGAAVERMARRHARTRIHIQAGESAHLIDHHLRGHLVEFAIVRPPRMPLAAGLQGEPLFFDPYVIVVGSTHPHAKRRRIGLEALLHEQWIISPAENADESPLRQAFAAQALAVPVPRLVSSSLNLRYALLASGRWVTLMPRSILHFLKPPTPLKALPIELPLWDTPNMIITNRERRVGPVAEKFLETVRSLSAALKA